MSFFKKSLLSCVFVLLLLFVLVFPCFASIPITDEQVLIWHNRYVDNESVRSLTQYQSSNKSLLISEELAQSPTSNLVLVDLRDIGLIPGQTYFFSFDIQNYSSSSNPSYYTLLDSCFVFYDGEMNLLNYVAPHTSGYGSRNWTIKVPDESCYIGLLISGTCQNYARFYCILTPLNIRLVNTTDVGSWTGPDLQITDIDIANDITNIGTTGGSLITFLQNGFSSVRVGVIGVAALFTSCWDYLTTFTPELTYIIVFGLVLGLLGMLISIFKFGKESGNTGKSSSSKSDRGGGSS